MAGGRAEAQEDATAATEHFGTALRDHPALRSRLRIGLKLGRSAVAAMLHDGTVQALRRLLAEAARPEPSADSCASVSAP